MFVFLWLALFSFLCSLAFPALPLSFVAWSSLLTFVMSYYWPLPLIVSIIFYSIALVLMHGSYFYIHYKKKNTPAYLIQSQSLVGTHILLDKPIHSGKSTVQIKGDVWNVHGPDLPIGTLVTIVAVIDGILIVEAHQS